MADLFNAVQNQSIRARIQRLTPDATASWGKMSVAQMLAHCVVPLEVALGTRRLKRSVIGFLFGKLAKKKLTGPQPFDKNLPTDGSFIVTDVRDFDREQRQLEAVVERFQQQGASGITRDPHPFFGPLTPAEWSTLQWKHLDHHLRQFGA